MHNFISKFKVIKFMIDIKFFVLGKMGNNISLFSRSYVHIKKEIKKIEYRLIYIQIQYFKEKISRSRILFLVIYLRNYIFKG